MVYCLFLRLFPRSHARSPSSHKLGSRWHRPPRAPRRLDTCSILFYSILFYGAPRHGVHGRRSARGANGRRRRPCTPRLGKEAVAVHLFLVTVLFRVRLRRQWQIQGGILGPAPTALTDTCCTNSRGLFGGSFANLSRSSRCSEICRRLRGRCRAAPRAPVRLRPTLPGARESFAGLWNAEREVGLDCGRIAFVSSPEIVNSFVDLVYACVNESVSTHCRTVPTLSLA